MPRVVAYLAGLLTLTAAGAEAHHSVLGFDSAHAITLRGVVTEVLWNNPHTYIVVMARPATNGHAANDGASRAPARWVIESESPIALRRLGWTRDSVRPGDAIVTLGAPDRHGRPIMRCQSVTVEGPASGPTSSGPVSDGQGRPHGHAFVRGQSAETSRRTPGPRQPLPCYPPTTQ